MGHWWTTHDCAEHCTDTAAVTAVDDAAARRLLKINPTDVGSSQRAPDVSKELARSPGCKSVTALIDMDAILLAIWAAFISPFSSVDQPVQPPNTSVGVAL
jgi:hypothetical protein